MSRRRYLSTDAGRDRALRDVAKQSMFANSFYLLGIPAAGDDCTLPTNDPEELLCEVWPMMARDYSADDVRGVIDLLLEKGLWEYAPSGRLRYPPRSFYKYQTYIKGDRRGEGNAEQRTAPETAQTAEISAEQRKSAQNGASFSFSSSSSLKQDLLPTVVGTKRAKARAPATPSQKGRKRSDDELARHKAVWTALEEGIGIVKTTPARSLRAAKCWELVDAGYDPSAIAEGIDAYKAHMPAAELTDTALVKHIDRVLTQPVPRPQERTYTTPSDHVHQAIERARNGEPPAFDYSFPGERPEPPALPSDRGNGRVGDGEARRRLPA